MIKCTRPLRLVIQERFHPSRITLARPHRYASPKSRRMAYSSRASDTLITPALGEIDRTDLPLIGHAGATHGTEPTPSGSSAKQDPNYAHRLVQPSNTASLPPHLAMLQTQIAATFLDKNQPCVAPLPKSPGKLSEEARTITAISMGARIGTMTSNPIPDRDYRGLGETVLALSTPFEGGDFYVDEAVQAVAGSLDTELVVIDLAVAVGLGIGSSSTNSNRPVQLPAHRNPLLLPGRDRAAHQEDGITVSEDSPFENALQESAAEDEGRPVGMILTLPDRDESRSSGSSRQWTVDEGWVNYFRSIIEQNEQPDPRPRIVLLQSTTAMAETFDGWWPSLVEAVRSRRGAKATTSPTAGRKTTARLSRPTLNRPTSIILSCAPSLLAAHTGRSSIPTAESGSAVADSIQGLQDIDQEPYWWTSQENDLAGREKRNQRRLKGIRPGDLSPTTTIPSLGPQGGKSSAPHSPSSILAAIRAQMSQGPQSSNEEGSNAPLISRSISIIPLARDRAREESTRRSTRRMLTLGLLERSLNELGATLSDPDVLAPSSTQEQDQHIGSWANRMITAAEATQIATSAVARQSVANSATGSQSSPRQSISLGDLESAQRKDAEELQRLAVPLREYMKAIPSADTIETSSTRTDSVVEDLKRSKTLSQHEKRLLSCIVDPSKLGSTTFADVHLPYNTIDAIRTLVSLPLLFPESFRGGVLRDHATTGALLFGPPGTGKTLLARAVASESGARMLAIQSSDVNDMYVGEGEKMVKAVFSLARKLSPCVIFIDEVDSLFGSRAGHAGSGWSQVHNQLLTEFMQEMDGINSAIENRDSRIVVIGATNRPYDLDDAILRRLPRRLLIDLPEQKDRQAILEILLRNETLDSDVHIERLANDTDGYSGSDLKHLCISAALASVKENIKVPWELASNVVSASERSTFKPTHAVATELPSTVELVQPGTKRLTVEGPSSAIDSDRIMANIRADQGVTKSQSANGLTSEVDNSLRTDTISVDNVTNPAATSVDESSRTSSDSEAATNRVLAWRHFEIAFKEVRPSSSEEGTLPALRKWAEQFGEGGKRKGQKSGFGKSFGFGDKPAGTQQTGFGRVASDEQ